MNLPNYQTEPGIPGSVTDLIIDRAHPYKDSYPAIEWISSYQGETHYKVRGHDGRLHFRWGKVPWKWHGETKSYWNWPTEADFQREFNGAWGILHTGSNPVDQKTLETFRAIYFPKAVTGYYDHQTHSWVICEPTTEKLSTISWKKTDQYKQFCLDYNLQP